MELTDIIRNATGGFLAGFVLGASGTCDRYKEKVEFLEATLTKEEREKAGLNDDKLKEIVKHERKGNLILPYAVGGVYALISGIATQSTITDGMVVAIPSAYIGRVAGSVVRKLVKATHRKDLEIAKKIRDNPENALDYIPSDRRKTIEQTLSEIERKILNGESLDDKELRAESGSLKRMYDAIIADNKVYSPVLVKWSLGKFQDVCQTATVQRELTRFYESDEPMSVAVFGKPQNTSIAIYEREGKSLRLYNASFDNFRMVERDGVGIMVEGTAPQLQLENEHEWNGDYKSLAKEVMKNQPTHTTMLLRSPEGLPEPLKAMMVTETFATAFVTYKKMKSDRERPTRRPYGLDNFSLN